MLGEKNRAVDSDRAIAFAQYTRRLQLKAWRALYGRKLERGNQRLIGDMAR